MLNHHFILGLRPMSQAVAGPQGEAEAVAEGQAVGGPGVSTISAPQAVSLAGPGGIAVATTFSTSNAVGLGFGISSDSRLGSGIGSSNRPGRPPGVTAPFLGGAIPPDELDSEDGVENKIIPDHQSQQQGQGHSSNFVDSAPQSNPDYIEIKRSPYSYPLFPQFYFLRRSNDEEAFERDVMPVTFVQHNNVFSLQKHGPQFFYAYNFQ